MAVEKTYLNSYGSVVSNTQVLSLSEYSIKTVIDNKLKSIDDFDEGAQTGGSYYLDENETLNNLIQEHCINKQQKWVFHFNRQVLGNFTLFDWSEINKTGTLLFKGKEVLDNLNRKIFSCSLDLQTNEFIGFPRKYYYQNLYDNEKDDVLFHFEYGSDGSLKYIWDPNEVYYDKNFGPTPDDFLNDSQMQAVFPYANHPYYHSALPYLPINGVL